MKIGKVYKMVRTVENCSECGTEKKNVLRSFPFNEPYGMFLGFEPSGFLTFRLSGSRWASMNGGSYEEVKANIEYRFKVKK